jgi:DNA/RNA-binding domain of Phe-tRNA-synthetase-like protein
VQAMFLTEIKTSLLIAGHDLGKCSLPLTIQMSQGGETYEGFGNRMIAVKPNDICLSDQEGLILSIIYGQDEKTRITEDTSHVLFLVDGVPGLDKIHFEDGLNTLMSYLNVLDPSADVIEKKVISFSTAK